MKAQIVKTSLGYSVDFIAESHAERAAINEAFEFSHVDEDAFYGATAFRETSSSIIGVSKDKIGMVTQINGKMPELELRIFPKED